jgi:hypothetical protein
MLTILFAATLGLAQVPPAPATPAPVPVAVTTPAKAAIPEVPLTFSSESHAFAWDRMIPLTVNVDGLRINSIFFNKRKIEPGFFDLFKGVEFGTRAEVEVTNTSKYPVIPGFAVAVFDKDGRLLGVASGGTRFGTVKPGSTETFDLNFTQVKERLPLGDHFLLTIELRN